MDCSKRLHDRIEVAFEDPHEVSPMCYKYISFNWLGNCQMYEDGLCMLHAQKGEDSLPKICRLYPRSLKKINDCYIACCSSSCEAVVEMLYTDKQMSIIKQDLDLTPSIEYRVNEDMYSQLMRINNYLKDNSISLKQRIINICKYIDSEQFSQEYNNNDNPISLAIEILNRLIQSQNFFADICNEIIDRYSNNQQQYYIDAKQFENKYIIWETFFENVLNNSLIYENFPFVDECFDKTNAFKGLCASYGLLRIVCIGYTSIHSDENSLIDAVSGLFHLIDHTAFYYNINVICDNTACLMKL